MKKPGLYIIFLAGLLVSSCAHELPLTGGEKDTTPPVAKKFDPPNKTTRFASKKITIEFDEFVRLKDATKQILISPPGTQFEAAEKGQSIQVTITSPLKPNTTYVINFGSAIIDNNEGNVLAGLVYTFSTGDAVDSLSSSFLVLDAYTLQPVGKVQVMLYDEDIDSLPRTALPYYAGITDDIGKATVAFMKPGSFKVFLLQEENKNYLYDKPNEGIGFLTEPVITGSDSGVHKILFFKEEVMNAKVLSAKMQVAGMVNFKFTGTVQKEQLEIISKNYTLDTSKFEFIGPKKDSAVYWFKPQLGKDTLFFRFNRKMGEKDTIKVYPKTPNRYLNNVSTGATPVKIVTTVPADFDFYKKLELEFSASLDSLGFDTIVVKEEGKRIPSVFKPVNDVERKYYLDYNFKQSKNYTVYFPGKSVKGILGTYIDSTVISFKTSNDKTYKTVTLNIKNPEFGGGAILQILDTKDVILEEKTIQWSDSTVVEFKNLRQGSYRIRLIYDVNNNRKWDTGNYAEKRQPEKVVYFPQNIDIKPNFDYILEWDIQK